MINDKLKRIGDTSFRLKNQVNFYTNLLEEINLFTKSNPIDLEKIFNNLIDSKVINYKKNNLQYAKLMVKQLILFGLLNKNDNELLCSNLFNEFMKITSDEFRNFHEKTSISFHEIFFLILILLNDNNNSKQMKNFIEFIKDKKNIDNNIIGLFSFCDSIEEMDEFSNYERSQVLFKLFNSLSQKYFNEFISYFKNKKFNNNDAFKKLNKIMKNIGNPSFKKPIKDLDIFIKFLNQSNIKNINIKNIKIILKKINKYFFINNNFFKNYDFNSSENKLKLFNYFIFLKKYELIYKDYLDINKRWFLNTKLIKEYIVANKKPNNSFIVNNIVVSFLIEIKNKYEIINEKNLKEIFYFSLDYFSKNNKNNEIKYPFNIEDVSWFLDLFYENKESEVYNFLSKKGISEIPNYVIFEYFVNLSFSLSYGYKPKDFIKKYCSTKLDSNLLPITHAPGNMSDGLIIDVKDNHKIFSTIESTILKNNLLHTEKEPIQRHAYEYLKNNKEELNNDLPTCIFVINEKLLDNEIKLFSSNEQSSYIKNLDKKIRIIFLNSKILSFLLKENKLDRLLRYFVDKIPFKKTNNNEPLNKWYVNMFNKVY